MFVQVKFLRDKKVIHEERFMKLDDLPRLGETVSLPGSGARHEVAFIHRKIGRRREGGTQVRQLTVELRKPEKK